MCSHFCRQMTVAAPGSARDDGLVTLAVHLSLARSDSAEVRVLCSQTGGDCHIVTPSCPCCQ